ncbi:MAG TPA: DUF1343 domain-containing protein [Chitinophagaceae bacterium]|nr:DUF1343 domain-containing protein [Chitinophagaceae bacterium]
MKKDPLYKILKKSVSTGLLCNQAGWHASTGTYSFQWLAKQCRLTKVFIPEHGLFGELQDQVKLNDTSDYRFLNEKIEWISLYSSGEKSLSASEEQLKSIDTLVIDLQDVGSRYYTFTSSTWLLLEKITVLGLDTRIIVLDKPNPAGRQVEGTRITKEYASFIGLEGLPHRHGLTLGEICRYFKQKLGGKWELIIQVADKKNDLFIPPSPNIPTTATCALYSGQCLWEGTNISEGRGTALPFQLTGAPFMNWVFKEDWNNKKHPVYQKYCQVRPLRFIPVFHKFAQVTCSGLQLLPFGKHVYHSLSHSLQLIRFTREKSGEFEWRQGPYEAFNDKTAIELLAGDPLLLDYLNGKSEWKEVRAKLDQEEDDWIKESKPFLLYKPFLQKLKLNK